MYTRKCAPPRLLHDNFNINRAIARNRKCSMQRSKKSYTPEVTMHDRAPELLPLVAPPGCHVSDLGGESPVGSKIFWTSTRAEESNITMDGGESDGAANSS